MPSATLVANGFSTITCLPASIALEGERGVRARRRRYHHRVDVIECVIQGRVTRDLGKAVRSAATRSSLGSITTTWPTESSDRIVLTCFEPQ